MTDSYAIVCTLAIGLLMLGLAWMMGLQPDDVTFAVPR